MSDPALTSDATQRLLELKKKLLSGKHSSGDHPQQPQALKQTVESSPKPLTRSSSPLEPIKLIESPPETKKTGEVSPVVAASSTNSSATKASKKQPLTLKSLMGSKYASKRKSEQQQKEEEQPTAVTFSRLKEAPALRKLIPNDESEESKPKLISLTGGAVKSTPLMVASSPEPVKSVADVIAKFEEHPPPALLAAQSTNRIQHPFAPVEETPIPTLISVEKEPMEEEKIAVTFAQPSIDMDVGEFIESHRNWLKKRRISMGGGQVHAFIRQHRDDVK
jgi:hypothetical protein